MTHKNPRASLDALLDIMQALRAPHGCPWDAKQTPESLTPYILEEACELIDAIEEGSTELILDELGDLLLQVVFQAQIFNEQQQFDFHDVVAGIAEKLVRRHPHVFDRDKPAVHVSELDKQWAAIKRSESTHNKSCLADHLPNKLPALQRAQKLVAKTCQAGRQSELPDADQKLLLQMIGTKDGYESCPLDEAALGQILFQLVRCAYDADLDAEAALRKTTQKTIKQLDPG
ncbi:MAG: MazG family protein [Desulfuromonadales bacterium]